MLWQRQLLISSMDTDIYNCDQSKIIETLIGKFQPEQNCQYVSNFEYVPFEFTFWTGSKIFSRTIDLRLKLQLQDKQPIVPLMTSQNLDSHNMRMIVVYESDPNKTLAVYVKSFEKAKGNSDFIFHCINSWGEKDPHPVIASKDVINLYYVSLYIDQNPVTNRFLEIFSVSFFKFKSWNQIANSYSCVFVQCTYILSNTSFIVGLSDEWIFEKLVPSNIELSSFVFKNILFVNKMSAF